MSNIFVGVISNKKNLHKLKPLCNYYEKNNINFKIFTGSNDSTHSKHIVNLNCEDDYLNLKFKVKKALTYAFEKYNFDYFLKIDDDSFLDITALKKLDLKKCDYAGIVSSFKKHLKFLENSQHYYMQKAKNKSIDFSHYSKFSKNFKYAVGAGYFLSKKAVLRVIETFSKYSTPFYQEDMTIGYINYMNNISPLNIGASKKHSFFDTAKNGLIVHPINFLLHKKIFSECSTKERKIILNKFINLNPYYNSSIIK
jgi:hypothetical protein